MAVSTIGYTNKVDLNTTTVADINKVKAADMNEIKSVVNNNATELTGAITTINSIYKEYELYNSTTGGTTGDVTLSDSSANYDYMEIYFRSNDGTDNVGSQKVYQPNGKTTYLLYWFLFDGGTNNTYAKIKKVNISGTSISVASYAEINITNGTTASANDGIYITRVVGYKV